MTDAAEQFLTALERGYQPLLAKASGRLAIQLVDGPRWVVTLENGNVTVTRGDDAADAMVTLDRSLFERIVRGEANATTAVLRGEVQVEGGLDLLMALQRLFPGPDGSTPSGEGSRQ